MSAEPAPKSVAPASHPWADLNDEALLKLRFCDLKLQLKDTPLHERIRQVLSELKARKLRFGPYFWFSTEWFTPDGVTGIALPFYLGHPRLTELERKIMLQAEGDTPESCLKIIRHEVGHAIDHAFRLHRRKDYRKVFGPPTIRYPEYYQPKPHSRRFVLHIQNWYAQSHPAEDFAETFAVWLTPGSQWEQRYQTWPAIKKLRFVDRLMTELADKKTLVRTRKKDDPIEKLTMSLAEHYEEKRERYADHPDFYDRDLRKLFSAAPEFAANEKAAKFLRRLRPQIRRIAARWTGAYQYTIDQVLKEMIQRCRELNLRLKTSEAQSEVEATVLLTVETMNYIRDGRHRLLL
ncbi:MAG TPA: putative zinc-binding metallopeptidase [Phycisphaerae bacterium]|nr:putative zinc-binding metallopeptidase [Phycisphaerae bacterium]